MFRCLEDPLSMRRNEGTLRRQSLKQCNDCPFGTSLSVNAEHVIGDGYFCSILIFEHQHVHCEIHSEHREIENGENAKSN